jgi:hypothetical protein
MEALNRTLYMRNIAFPSETESATTIQALVASYLAHNGYVASIRGFARDIEEEERAFGQIGRSGSGSPERSLRLEEGEEKDVSRRQRISFLVSF